MKKEQVMYWKMVWTGEPTKMDKIGCDGLYIKSVAPCKIKNNHIDIIAGARCPRHERLNSCPLDCGWNCGDEPCIIKEIE